jgi:uncharacterized protein YndB with AHSA1/START domain
MTTNKEVSITKDLKNKKILIVREFDAPVDKVWKAWTDKNLLDSWWAPKPWKAKSKSMDFREGGSWMYAMVGPDGTETWARVDFKTIRDNKSFTAEDYFTDENGKKNEDMPSMQWKNEFQPNNSGTKVTTEITFSKEADLEKLLEMGFEEGYKAALKNLDELLASRK